MVFIPETFPECTLNIQLLTPFFPTHLPIIEECIRTQECNRSRFTETHVNMKTCSTRSDVRIQTGNLLQCLTNASRLRLVLPGTCATGLAVSLTLAAIRCS